jgi:hypothetical protein
MSFESADRIAALAPENVGTIFPQLVAAFGEDLPDGDELKRTIGAFWDDTSRTRKRAASLTDGTIKPIVLSDVRVAYRCLWQSDLVRAWEAGQLPAVEQLSEAQFAALRPKGGQ